MAVAVIGIETVEKLEPLISNRADRLPAVQLAANAIWIVQLPPAAIGEPATQVPPVVVNTPIATVPPVSTADHVGAVAAEPVFCTVITFEAESEPTGTLPNAKEVGAAVTVVVPAFTCSTVEMGSGTTPPAEEVTVTCPL